MISVTKKKTATTKMVAIKRKKSLLLPERRTTFSLFWGRSAPNLRLAKQMVGLVAFELSLEDEVCGQVLDFDVHKFCWPPDNLPFDSWVRSVLNCYAREHKYFRVVLVRPPCRNGPRPQSHPGVHRDLQSTRYQIVIVGKEGISRIYPVLICTPS